MKPEKWQKVKDLFVEAEEIPRRKLGEFLDKASGGDRELKAEVEKLLNFKEEEDDDFLQNTAVAEIASDMIQTQKLSRADERARELETKHFAEGELLQEHYRIVRLLGRGGMGEVYLAQDTKLDRKVALKLLPAYFAGSDERMQRFVREAKAVSALNHPNIITIHEIGEIENTNFITTEYIEGKTLNRHLKDKPFDIKTTLDIAIQIASALTAAHEAGIVHRDIKPDNIMIRHDGIVKILDFGLAKPISETIEADFGKQLRSIPDIDLDEQLQSHPGNITFPGVIMGTPHYMSPEQALGRDIDARTDIFSFGIVLYEMIEGKLPFVGKNYIEVIDSILKVEPFPFENQNDEIPPKLKEFTRILRIELK